MIHRLKTDDRSGAFADLGRTVREVRLLVRPEEGGERLDRFLVRELPWRSRSRFQRLIREGSVTVGGAPVPPNRRVRPGDEVLVRLPDVPGAITPVPLRILHEDPWLLALDKGPDVLVHPVGRHRYDTLINTLHARYRRPDEPAQDRVPRLCHRIDRETSGVVLVALDDAVHVAVQQQFEHRRVRKEYLAVVRGEIREPLTVDLPMGRDEGHAIRLKMAAAPGLSLPSRTEIVPQQVLSGHTLIAARPLTGRQHQIRAHLEAIGHPIVCDPIYGRPDAEGPASQFLEVAGRVVASRLALHAHRLDFLHPVRGERMEVVAPLAEDLARLVEALA